MRNISSSDILRDANELLEILRDLGRKHSLRDPIGQALEQMQFTPAQVHTILWLGTDGAMTMGEIARRLGITEKTITGVIDRLENEGLLRRERGVKDRRVIQVVLTRKGSGVYKKIDTCLHEKMLMTLGLLDAAERRTLIGIIQKLSTRLLEASPRRAV